MHIRPALELLPVRLQGHLLLRRQLLRAPNLHHASHTHRAQARGHTPRRLPAQAAAHAHAHRRADGDEGQDGEQAQRSWRSVLGRLHIQSRGPPQGSKQVVTGAVHLKRARSQKQKKDLPRVGEVQRRGPQASAGDVARRDVRVAGSEQQRVW